MGCGLSGGCCTQAVAFNTWGGEPRADRPNGGFYVEENAETSKTLDSQGGLNPSASQGGTVVAQGFTYSGYSNQPAWMTGDRTDCLPASGHSDGSHQGVGVAVGFSHSAAANSHGVAYVEEGTPPIRGGGAGNSMPAIAQAMAVRRLTPRECERLQGFPDDYTLIEYRKKPAADGPRYRALGNSMAVPCMAWLGYRIQLATGHDNA